MSPVPWRWFHTHTHFLTAVPNETTSGFFFSFSSSVWRHSCRLFLTWLGFCSERKELRCHDLGRSFPTGIHKRNISDTTYFFFFLSPCSFITSRVFFNLRVYLQQQQQQQQLSLGAHDRWQLLCVLLLLADGCVPG